MGNFLVIAIKLMWDHSHLECFLTWEQPMEC